MKATDLRGRTQPRPKGPLIAALQLDARRLAPELLEPVVLARLRDEHVKHAVEVVEEHPARLAETLLGRDGSNPPSFNCRRTSSAIAFANRSFRAVTSTRKSV